MNRLRLLGAVYVLALTWSVSTVTNASIVYNVDRIIGDGAVTGFIETDGTLGVLGETHIMDWTFTLTAPNLDGGSPDVIFLGSKFGAAFIIGSGLTATSSQLLFDFSLASESFFSFSGDDARQNFWCLETASASCTGNGIGEHIGWPEGEVGSAQAAAQSQVYTDKVVIAQVQTVPIPAAAWLFVSGLLGLVSMARHKKA